MLCTGRISQFSVQSMFQLGKCILHLLIIFMVSLVKPAAAQKKEMTSQSAGSFGVTCARGWIVKN